MTKESRDNFQNDTFDEADTVEFTFFDKNFNGKSEWGRVKGDVERAYFLKSILGTMGKAPKWEKYVPAKRDDDGKILEKGYWERVN